jgi:ABC-2 type transport system permease protein
MSLVRAGAFLVAASARNRVRVAIRKLREPRYLVGAAAVALYLWSLFFRSTLHGKPDPDLAAMQDARGLMRLGVELAATFGGALAVFVAWTTGPDRLSFSFSEAEATWLLSGPVSRRGVVRYKVCVGLLRTLFSAVLATLIFRRGVAASPLALVLGTWLGFSVLWLNGAAASLVRTRWKQASVSVSRRVVVGSLLLGLGVLTALSALKEAGPLPSFDAADYHQLTAGLTPWLRLAVEAPAIRWAFIPGGAFAASVLAKSLSQALGPLAVLALLDLVLLGWVLRLDVPLEEAVLASAERRSRLEARRRRRGVPMPTLSRAPVLRASGAPELALSWKNWLALRRVYGARLGLLLVVVGLGFGSAVWGAFHRSGLGADLRGFGAACVAALAALLVLIGPFLYRTDLRSDMRRLDILRTLPLSGLQVVRGELVAPAAMLAATQVALLVFAFGLSADMRIPGFPLATRLALTAGAVLLLPAMTVAMLVVQNAAALVFSSLLVDDEEQAPRGVEAAGTRLLNLGASLLLLLVGFVPGAILGLAVGAVAGYAGLGPLAYTLGCAATAAVLLGEVLLALKWMGLGLDRLDPTTA